jgi:hypothetical protein
MPINGRIVDIVDKGMAGLGLDEPEIVELLKVNPYSAEGSYIRWGGWMLSRKASDGYAEIHASTTVKLRFKNHAGRFQKAF